RRRHTRLQGDWSSDVCSSDLMGADFDPNTGGSAGLRTLYGSLGRGGYECIHPDDSGDIWIVEDVGGTLVLNNAKNPNSFVYRFRSEERRVGKECRSRWARCEY